jgi:two-component system, NtrC family, sensor histidine kinase AtoS
LHDTLILIQSRGKSHGVTFDIQINDQLPQVYLDGEQFKQVFLNLLLNSLQALEQGGTIGIQAHYREETDELEVVFSDTGPGIPAHLRERVFDPFFTTKPAGTGLGMAVAQRIVSAQGGHIYIDENPGGGAMIQIYIPRMPKQEEV